MFDKISNGFSLVGSTWRVLLKDKHLLLFPMISGFLFMLVVASFVVPLAVLVDWNQVGNQMAKNNNRPPVWVYPVTFAFYFCTYFVIIFCNSALISCALIRFNGGTPRLADGFRMAFARLPQIFAWALVSATVGVLLKAVENIHEKVGEIVASLLGTAWSIMTYFVVPVLVVEKTGPVEAVGRSLSILRKAWGEALVGNLGLNFVMFLLALPIVLLIIVGAYMFAQGSAALGLALIIVAGIGFLIHTAIGAALHTIHLAALYQFATTDRVPDGFDRNVMASAFAR